MPAWFALKPILGLLRRFWWAIPILGLVAALLITRGTLERRTEALEACKANHTQFVADVKSKTELARLRDAENKARVEREQEKIRSENDAQIRSRIAAARADRVRTATAKAHPGSGGNPSVPGTANAPLHPVGEGTAAQLHVADDLICIDNTIKAEGWQDWWKEVSAIER